MERAIQNILVNAIRYSPNGEVIRISLSETHGTIRGESENTGARVSDDAIPHLFEAFYRADTSRNRNTGGTGCAVVDSRRVRGVDEQTEKRDGIFDRNRRWLV